MAPNPGPMTLAGTNSYLVGRNPAFLIDPGPADEGHIAALRGEGERRGGIEATVLTHGHGDHADGAELLGVEVIRPADGEAVGPLRAVATPGHAADHVCLLLSPAGTDPPAPSAAGLVCFSGDLILGEGSSFVPPREAGGSLAEYLDSLWRLEELDLELICPGHGPYVRDPGAKIAEYIEHRLDRERRLLAALDRGDRSRARLLEEVWDDVPAELRGAAAIVMQAHLEKLEAEGRLPGDLTR